MACRLLGRRATTFEVLDEKATLARETFALTSIDDVVEFIHGDARDHLPSCEEISFCFLDAEKDIYAECYEAVVPNSTKGGIRVADSAINLEATLWPVLERALADDRVDAMVVPLANGDLVCRQLETVEVDLDSAAGRRDRQ